jgi:hypothetical protein
MGEHGGDTASREALRSSLANLFGDEDGAGDILEHVLTIETGEVSSL